MKKWLATLLTVVMLLSMVGCGNTATEETEATETEAATTQTEASVEDTKEAVTLVGEGSPFEGEAVNNDEFTLRLAVSGSADIVELATSIWKVKYPNATVEQIDSAWGSGGADARSKQLIMLSGGETVDVGKVVWGKEFYDEGIIIDLSDVIESFDIFPYLSEGQISRMTLNGNYYGTTTTNNTVFLFANMDILAQVGVTEVPATIDELEAIAEKISAAGLKTADGKDIYLTNFEGGCWTTDYWLWAFGGKQMNEDYTETLINSPESIAAYERMQSYVEKGWAPKIDGTGNQAWLNGQLAFYVGGNWDLASTNEAGINAVYSAMPAGVTGERTTSIGGAEWVVFTQSEHQAEAIDWLRALSSDEFNDQFTRVTNAKYYDDERLIEAWKADGKYEGMMAEKEQMTTTTYNFLEAPYSYPDASSIYATALEKILTGMQDVTEVMNAAAEQINTGIAAYHN